MKTLIAFAVAAFVSTAGFADDKPSRATEDRSRGTQASFESLDRNSDQQLSKAEVSADATLSTQFASLDADADGYVSKSEFKGRTKRQSPKED
ncbi:MAG: EF-hand domain-containing protein [Steroidobacter sp.]